MQLRKIKNLSEKRAGGLRKLAADIGMSEPNIHRCINNNDMKASDLERVAQIFGVPISYFFDDEEQAEPKPKKRRGCGDALLSAVEGLAGGSGREELQSQIDHLSAELADARQIIDTLQRQLHLNSNYITLLEKQLSDTTNNQKGDNAATA